jgi:hypothetical protein
VLKKAVGLRSTMKDSGKGWVFISTEKHSDRRDWSPLKRFVHGERVYKELSPKAVISVGCIIDIGAVCVSTDRNFRVLSQAEHARIASST